MGILDKIFKRKQPERTERFETISGSPAVFNGFNGSAYENDIYRSAIDSIARNVAKLKPTHIVAKGDQRKSGDYEINRILQTRPNRFMTAYDLIYKLTTHYYLNNNAFAYLDKDKRGNLKGIYPLPSSNMEFVTDFTGELYCKFNFNNGKTSIFAYKDVIHIKRFYNSNDLLGDNNSAIDGTLNLACTQSEGMEQTIKAGATIRGVLKYNTVLSPEKLKLEKDVFIKDYLSMSNNGGVVATDSKAEYIPLETKPLSIDEGQLNNIKNKIYQYLGISESIVNSSYTEDEYSAFHESIIEPISIQLSLEFTEKVFSQREQKFGNSIIFETNRLQFSNNSTKTKMLKELMPLGLFSINQALEMLNLPTVDDGDRRLQTLNVVSNELVDDYQMESKLKKVGERENE